MSDYIVEVQGSNSLHQIELAIAGEEATGSEFRRSNLSFHDGRVTNLLTFKDLPPGQRPHTPIVLVRHGDPVPSNKLSVWGGVMLVSGSNVAVSAFR